MKKLISALLTLIFALSICTTAYAANSSKAGKKSFDRLPNSVEVPVVIKANVWYYAGAVKDGSVTVKGPGVTASSNKVPAGAVRLVVVPITDKDALKWFSECLGVSWNVLGTIYAVYYEDANGNRLPAYDVKMKVEIPSGYDNLNVFSLNPDGKANALGYTALNTIVTYTTDGQLYYGVAYSRDGAHVEPIDDNDTTGPSTSNNSQTGNKSYINLWFLIAGLTAVSFAYESFRGRKRKIEGK